MRQVVLEEPGRFALRTVPDPVPRAGEALVRVRRIGVCGTDLHAFGGRQPFFSYPRVLGHELSVTVEQLPEEQGADGGDRLPLRVGDVCAVRPFMNNPESRATRRGRPNCCEDLRVLGVHVDGGMGDLLALPPRFLHPVAGGDLDVLALVEPLGIGCHAVARAALTPADDVLVIGAGPIGLAVLQFATLDAGRVTVVDLAPGRLALAESLFAPEAGPASLLPAAAPSDRPTSAARLLVADAVPRGARFDVVFDATGSAVSMTRAFDVVAAGGRLVFVGLTLDPITFSDPDFHRREITLLASRNATPDDFRRVLATIRAGQARPAAWITHRLALDDVPAAFAQVKDDPTLVKAIIDVS